MNEFETQLSELLATGFINVVFTSKESFLTILQDFLFGKAAKDLFPITMKEVVKTTEDNVIIKLADQYITIRVCWEYRAVDADYKLMSLFILH